MSALRGETVGKLHFLRGSTHNSTSARWASKSSTGRNCLRYSVHGKTQDRRNNTTRHYTSSLAHSLKCRGLIPSNHKPERCCWAADDSQEGSRSHASDRCAARERARRTQWLAAATRALHLMQRMCATFVQRTRSAIQMRQVVRNFGPSPVRWHLTSRMTASLPSCSPVQFVGSWPKTDVPVVMSNVRFRGKQTSRVTTVMSVNDRCC